MHKCRKYTLVELITVMAIAAILMAIGVPAFISITKGNSVDQAASLVKTMLEQAQSNALSSRRHVALIVDYKDKRANEFQSMRLAYVRRGDSGYVFEQWLPDSQWRDVPAGSVIDIVCGMAAVANYDKLKDELHSKNDNKKLDPPFEMKVRTSDGSGLTSDKYPAVVFSKYGALPEADKALYFRVTEGIYSGGNFVYKNLDDGKPANFLILKVNQFTGQVRYERP